MREKKIIIPVSRSSGGVTGGRYAVFLVRECLCVSPWSVRVNACGDIPPPTTPLDHHDHTDGSKSSVICGGVYTLHRRRAGVAGRCPSLAAGAGRSQWRSVQTANRTRTPWADDIDGDKSRFNYNRHRFSRRIVMREILHLQAGQCGNQIGAKVNIKPSCIIVNNDSSDVSERDIM